MDIGAKPERTRQLIANAAGELLLERTKSWDKITVNAIATKAGVVKSTIFHNFPGGKEEVFDYMLKLRLEGIEEEWSTLGGNGPDISHMSIALSFIEWVFVSDPATARVILDDYDETFKRSDDSVGNRYSACLSLVAHAIELYYPLERQPEHSLKSFQLASILLPPLLRSAAAGSLGVYKDPRPEPQDHPDGRNRAGVTYFKHPEIKYAHSVVYAYIGNVNSQHLDSDDKAHRQDRPADRLARPSVEHVPLRIYGRDPDEGPKDIRFDGSKPRFP